MRPSESSPPDRGARVVFCLAAMVALAFALYTHHCWEDYFITFRSSKNLVTGHGLVYQVGERVHTFTSPLGVLLPAFTSWVSGGKSDNLALWLFRFISIAAFAGGVALVWKSGRAWGWRPSTCFLTAAFAMTDAKSVSFAINGMETGVLLFFLALCVAIFATGPKGCVWWLGAAWAGLMWTRPDSFIYIGAIGVGFWLFPSAQKIAASRAKLLLIYLRSGLVCTALYGPWLLWAWFYYGSPIPNTIVAKGTGHRIPPWTSLLADFLTMPYRSWHSRTGSGIFMPTYFGSGGWPRWCEIVCAVLAVAAFIAIVLPRVRAETRALSLAAFVGMFYLTNTELYPWYYPPVTLLAIFTLGALGESFLGALPAVSRTARIWLLPGAAAVLFSTMLLAESAWQLKWQQEIIEGQRREIGLWLRANRESNRDTVFLEPLGYIGYFSQLKMLDYPGMSSPEVIAARKKVGENWADLIGYLKPQWLILRPQEIHVYHLDSYPWFLAHYRVATVFDVRDKINALRHLPGWSYLQWDQTFYIYHRNEETAYPPPSYD
jgi:hypothetical protein